MKTVPGNRASKVVSKLRGAPVLVVGSLLCALGLTAWGDTHAQSQRHDVRSHARLSSAADADDLRVLDWTLWNISKYYVEPDRIDPKAMTLAGLEALENTIAEVLVQPVGKGDKVKVKVGTAEQEFDIGQVEALWAVGPHVREVFRFVRRHVDLSAEEQQDAEYAIVAGVLGTLDPHTNLLRPTDFADMKASTKGSFGGLGIEVGMRDGAITVIRVIEGNPASKVDMQPGDRIVQIDSESTVTMSINEAVQRLRGAPGTTVAVYVMREGFDKAKPLKITRATIQLDSVIGEVLAEPDASGNACARSASSRSPATSPRPPVRSCARSSTSSRRRASRASCSICAQNPGGLLQAAVEVADAFLSTGTIVATVGVSSPREESFADDRYDFPDLPLVVLVDEGSASASEIVAGALRNLGRAVVIGRRTFGKGSVQVLHERKVADKELALKLTIAQYLTPGDVSIQSVGVNPDIETMPVWIGKEHIAYFGRDRFDLLREESLVAAPRLRCGAQREAGLRAAVLPRPRLGRRRRRGRGRRRRRRQAGTAAEGPEDTEEEGAHRGRGAHQHAARGLRDPHRARARVAGDVERSRGHPRRARGLRPRAGRCRAGEGRPEPAGARRSTGRAGPRARPVRRSSRSRSRATRPAT